ncbi:malate dehydrogenase [Candidatus Woesearchaeota archaeon]|nr:malate dehydrogenase [Candidatus Woesearchaeota archaeon]
MPKLTIIGAGNVGAQVAFYAAIKNLADIVLIDVIEGVPQGKALDIQQAMPLVGSNVHIIGSNEYALSKNSDIVIVTAGVPRKQGMTREDLIAINVKIMNSVIKEVVKHSPNTILIIVSNPLDAMVHVAYKLSNFPKERVMGMAGCLDSARFRTFIAEELHANVNEVEAMVLGGHGDSMVPIVNLCKVKGKPISTLLSPQKVDAIVERVRNGGAEIINYLKTGSAFFAPGLAIIEMVEAILKDQHKVLPCSVLLEGEYEVNGLFIGVPVKLGRKGMEKIIELDLSEVEKKEFEKSVEETKELVGKL